MTLVAGQDLAELDEDDWRAARDDLLGWIAAREGWVDGAGTLEYAPSRPPCLIQIESPMADPCEPTMIDTTELVVYPPLVSYHLDGREDLDDYSRSGWRYAQIPDAVQITGLDDRVVGGGLVRSLRIGEANPEQIRRQIEWIESWRWPLQLPQRDDPWVEHWEPVTAPADGDDLAVLLRKRGWVGLDDLVDGMPLVRRWPVWHYPKSGRGTMTVIMANDVRGTGYWVRPPRREHAALSFVDAAGLAAALDTIEAWTAKQPPRWTLRADLRDAASCPRCRRDAGEACHNDPAEDEWYAVHPERLSPAAMGNVGSNSGPAPGQRPQKQRPRRR